MPPPMPVPRSFDDMITQQVVWRMYHQRRVDSLNKDGWPLCEYTVALACRSVSQKTFTKVELHA